MTLLGRDQLAQKIADNGHAGTGGPTIQAGPSHLLTDTPCLLSPRPSVRPGWLQAHPPRARLAGVHAASERSSSYALPCVETRGEDSNLVV